MQQQQQPVPDPSLTTLVYRITSLEQHVQTLQSELRTYVPARENDLQLQSIRSTVERIEGDVKEARKQVTDLKENLEKNIKDQANIQINVLKWAIGIIVTIVILILTGVAVYYLTHPGG